MLGDERMLPCSADWPAVCGRLSVPEDRSRPDGRQIELNVRVIPAQDPNAAPDPVFFLAGGPGGAATESWAGAPGTFPEIHASRDIVLVDQRGTGGSAPIWLPEPPDVSGLPRRELPPALRAWLDEILAGLEADPRSYASPQAADDLDDVRAALGYDRIDLYGGSYGATLAQYYVRQHEEHVRAVVLDGGTLLDVPLLELWPKSSQDALDSVLERCADDPACRDAFPDPAGELASAMQRLARHPVETGVFDPWTEKHIVVDDDTLASAIHLLLVTSAAGDVPLTIHQAATGDLDAVAGRIAALSQDPETDVQRELMFWTIVCSEAWARSDPREIARVGDGSYALPSYLASSRDRALACRIAPEASLPPGDGAPVRSEVPFLLLNGAEDPQDPPSNVADAPIELPNSLVIAPAGLGHTVGHLGCLPQLVAAFLEAGSVDDLDTSCVASMSPPPFSTA
jgi:pimeloyl-ACP methyl ester carboxylesterase